jgi:hypothetical protein
VCNAIDTRITIVGSHFDPIPINVLRSDAGVRVPEVRGMTDVVWLGNTSLEATVAAGFEVGLHDVVVKNPLGPEGALPGGLEVVPPPTLASIMPSAGPQGADVAVVITGANFRPGIFASINGVSIVVNSSTATTIHATVTHDTLPVGGPYDLLVQNTEGCTATLPAAYTVLEGGILADFSINPPFGWTGEDTPVDVTVIDPATGDLFAATPIIEILTPAPVKLRRVSFLDDRTLRALVPKNIALGTYDVRVTNPDGSTRTKAAAFRVVGERVPDISTADNVNRSTADMSALVICGDAFDGATVSYYAVDDPTRTPIATFTPVLDTTGAGCTFGEPQKLTIGSFQIGTTGTYVLRVSKPGDIYEDFLQITVFSPSANPTGVTASSALNTGRRGAAVVHAKDDIGGRYVYAIGGDAYTSNDAASRVGHTPFATYEVAGLSPTGNLGSWQQLGALSQGLFAPAAAAVRVGGKSYIYVIGGHNGTAAVDTIERAMVLSQRNAPIVADPVGMSGGGLTGGTWYYRVAAVMPAADADNPGGEGLASDTAVLVADTLLASAQLSWPAVAGAESYRIYRSPTANAFVGSEVLLEERTAVELGCAATCSYVDSATPIDPAGRDKPLPPGSLGTWKTLTTVDPVGARFAHRAVVLGTRVFLFGGTNDGDASLATTLAWSDADTDGELGTFGGATPTAPTGCGANTVDRFFFGAAAVPPYLFFSFGTSDGAARIDNMIWIDSTTPTAWSCMTSPSTQRKMHTSAAIGDQVFVVGGDLSNGGAPYDTSAEIRSSLLTGSNPGNFQAPGSVELATERLFHDAVTVGGKSYIIGGFSNGNVLTSVEVLSQ